jgi:hypothetical protein
MSSLIGQRLGQYEITALLGKGGMATVYRATQTSMGRDVAIKVIKPDLAEVGDFVTRFEREARTVASLSHPYILKVFDYGHEGELVYLVMELLKGGSLADQIRRGAFTPAETLRALDQIGSALDYAHELGIIHRDLKPQNVLLDGKGNAHLTDFGIAKILSATVALTQSGTAMGTPAYMSPEQWQGLPLDSRADIYALGVMLYEMLTGRLPFDAETPFSMMHMHVNQPPPSVRDRRADLPPAVEQVIQRALAKNREDRFASAGELVEAFRTALSGQPVAAQAGTSSAAAGTPAPTRQPAAQAATIVESLPSDTSAPRRSNRALLLGLGALVVAVVVIGGGLAVLSGRATPTEVVQGMVTDERIITYLHQTETAKAYTATVAITATSVPTTPIAPTAIIPATGTLIAAVQTTTIPASNTAAPTQTPLPTNTPAPTATSTQTATITPTITPVPPTQTSLPTSTPIPTATAVPPTQTPVPTDTAAPTATPAPTEAHAIALAPATNAITLENASAVKSLHVWEGHTDRVLSVAYSPDGSMILSGGGDGDQTIRIWDAKTGHQEPELRGHDSGVTSLAFSPDGSMLASGSWDSTVRLWDWKTRQATLVLEGHTAEVLGVAFSPDGTLIASASMDGTVRLWDAKTGEALATLPGHTGGATGVAFSPDGSLLAVSGEDVVVRLWDVKTRKPKSTLRGHTKGTTSVAFSPDGSLLASGSVDDTIRLWNVKSGSTVRVLKGHESAPASVVFSPDGSLLASGSWDHTVRLWDVKTGEELNDLEGHTEEVYSVAFSPDGSQLVSGSVDKTIRVWGIP